MFTGLAVVNSYGEVSRIREFFRLAYGAGSSGKKKEYDVVILFDELPLRLLSSFNLGGVQKL